MKRFFIFVLALSCFTGGDMGLNAQSNVDGKKILIAYFSWSGNTRALAQYIHGKVGGDVFEIVRVKPYPTAFNATVAECQQEKWKTPYPELTARVSGFDSCDIIFIGYPMWDHTIPMPIASFVTSYNFRGKTVIPFSTHAGTGLLTSVQDMTRLVPGANVLEPIAIYGSQAKRSGALPEVDQWLRKIGVLN
jgi:flavodoxin